MECIYIDDLQKFLADRRITKTQKYILLCILCLDAEQSSPETVEVPYRTLEQFDVRGHGHIKENMSQLLSFGYLLEVYFGKREDGYRITKVKINRTIFLEADARDVERELKEA